MTTKRTAFSHVIQSVASRYRIKLNRFTLFPGPYLAKVVDEIFISCVVGEVSDKHRRVLVAFHVPLCLFLAHIIMHLCETDKRMVQCGCSIAVRPGREAIGGVAVTAGQYASENGWFRTIQRTEEGNSYSTCDTVSSLGAERGTRSLCSLTETATARMSRNGTNSRHKRILCNRLIYR